MEEKVNMKKGICILFAVTAVLCIVGAASGECGPKCIRAGCDYKREAGSSYCYMHRYYGAQSPSYSYVSHSNKPGTTNNTYSSNTTVTTRAAETTTTGYVETHSYKRSSACDSYDEGYDDFYMDGDYDYDRYDNDMDYAYGVEDAMDDECEFEEYE